MDIALQTKQILCPFCNSILGLDYRGTCTACDLADRSRCLLSFYKAIQPITSNLTCLNLSADKVIASQNFFQHIENSVFGGENSIDIMNIRQLDDTYQFVSCNHILEHVLDDVKAIHELIRVTSVAIQITVPVPTLANHGCEYGFADPNKDYHYRHYGSDFGSWLKNIIPNYKMIVAVPFDYVTGCYDLVFLVYKEDVFGDRVNSLLRSNKIPSIIL